MLGVILAGGESTRMGKDKATVEVAGRTMLEWVTAAVVEAGLQPMVAGRVEGPNDVEAFPDPGVPHRGPLAGLVGAMHHHADTPAVLISVDQPWVRPQTLRRLSEMDGPLPVVPVEAGVRQTTCAFYPPNIVGAAETELAGGGSLQSLLDVVSFTPVVDWRTWGEDGRSWYSVNTPADLENGLTRFGPPGRRS